MITYYKTVNYPDHTSLSYVMCVSCNLHYIRLTCSLEIFHGELDKCTTGTALYDARHNLTVRS